MGAALQASVRGMIITISTCILLLWTQVGHACAAEPEGLMVYAAASTTDCLQSIAKSYEQVTHVHVTCSFASSSTLARQIEQGAPADLFLSADQKWMDYLSEHRSIVPGSRSDLLGNELVFISPIGTALSLRLEKDFAIATAFKGRMAIGDPSHVPAGIYAQQALVHLRWWEALHDRLAPAADVRAVLRLVELGEVDLGIVYATDAQASSKIQIAAPIPASLHDPIRYPIALTVTAQPGAAAFLAYLHSLPASSVFTAAGFTVSPPAIPSAK